MPIALVTGASRGVGRGIAIALAEAGYKVYATSRRIDRASLPANIVRLPCDHLLDHETAAVFARIADESGTLDILVNSAWGGYERMLEDGEFTWEYPFWDQPEHRWPSMLDAGVRAAFVASSHAARLMVPHGRGLIVNISYWAAQKYMGNVIYGVAKAATDKMTADMAYDLKPYGVAVLSLYPGLVRTELVMQSAAAFDLSNSESPEFQGRVIAALARDPAILDRSGQVLVSAAVAKEFGITDIDGKSPTPLTLETA
ncbi:MAG TPA: SDR family NAD(P)-dependent oxidoreductase [Bryobacteraceae bacterium]|nr:SDR family NAD(P)-dependent oxidoreductase [Bryobacteraceae bacterium]